MKNLIATTVRIPKDALDLVSKVSDDRSESISVFIRRAVLKELASLGFLSDEQAKALGTTA